MANHSYTPPPDKPALQLAYGNYGGIQGLLQLFSTGLPELQLDFSPEHYLAFYEDFRDRETETDLSSAEDIDPEFYWIKGQDCWICICFEAHESYYSWRCYAPPDKREYYKAYLENTHF